MNMASFEGKPYMCFVLISCVLKVLVGKQGTANGISGFMCTRYNYELDAQYMECTWDIAHEYRNKSHFKLNVEWSIPRFNGIYSCALPSLNACKWTLDLNPDLDFEDETMLVNISVIDLEDNNRIEQQDYLIDLESIVKPEPVNQLTASLYNRNCIKVSWSHSIAWKGRIFRIKAKYLDVEVVKELKVKADELAIDPSSHEYSICGLLYYTIYRVSVECKPSIAGYWSDAKEIVIRTGKTVPSSPPQLPPGTFTFSDINDKGYRNVTVYWSKLNNDLWNGALHQYHVTIDSIPECSISMHRVIERITLPEVTFGVQSDCDYVIQIRAQNEIDYSTKAAVLNLERPSNLPKLPRDLLLEQTDTDSQQNVTWRYDHHKRNTSFTIVWCRKVLDGTCKNGIHYTYKHYQVIGDSPGTTTLRFQTPIHLPNFPKTAYRFGVSANIGRKYSGFKWSECSHEHMLNPPSISFVGNPDNESVKVLWKYSSCNMNYVSLGYSFVYHIRLCRSKLCDEPSERRYGIDQNQTTVSKIALGRTLCAKVFISYGDDVGPWSAIACYTQRPKHKLKNHELVVVAIVVLAIGSSICLIAGICGLHKLRRNYNTEIPVEIPLINTNSSESSRSF